MTIRWANKPDAVNPAIASRFQFGYHWRGVTDPERWAKKIMKHYLLIVLMVASGVALLARNDFWIGNRYSVSLSFGAADLGKKNAPTPKKVPPPEFPPEMIRAGVVGEVTFDYTVDSEGRVSEMTIVKTSAEEFAKSVSAVALAWVFNPAIELPSKKPVSARMRCKVRFSMTEEAEPNHALQPTAPSRRG